MARRFWSDELVFKALIIILGVVFLQCRLISGKNSSQVGRKINRLKRHALRSIQSEDGDIIDCIDIYKQPAFDHPVLRKHTIQMAPSYDTSTGINVKETKTDALKTGDTKSVVSGFSQLWQKSGSCPKGTIPVRRIREMEVFKSDSVERYGRKNPSISSTQQANYSKAILLTEGYSYSGVRGDIKVWNPRVEADDEYSTSQVSLKSGPYYFFESIETGWAVNPGVYGDRQTRLFVYWTADASNKTGCFDLTCPGFVQTSNEIALGSAIYPLSVPGGLPYEITMYIFKDPNTGNWWVQYGEKINIGYWPPELFSMLHYGNAECAEWGGEVYSSRVGQSPHTATAMGNGQFPDFVTGNSGVIGRLRIRENSIDLKFPEWVATYTDEFNCYDAYYVGDYTEDPEFYYGGPGKSPRCP